MLGDSTMMYVVIELMIYVCGIAVILAGLIAITCWALAQIYKAVRGLIRAVRR